MRLPINKIPLINPPLLLISQNPIPFLLIIPKIPLIALILTNITPLPILHIIPPLPLILTPILRKINPKPLKIATNPVPLIIIPINPFIDSLAMFQPFLIPSLITRAIDPCFLSLSMLLVIPPLAFIDRSVFSFENPESFYFVVDEVSYVEV